MIGKYVQNREDRINGIYHGIPLYQYFTLFGQVLPTIPRACNIMFCANSGIGKSNSWRGLVLYPTYKIAKKLNLKVKFLIFLLEDTKDEFQDYVMSMVLKNEFNKVVSPTDLNSNGVEILSQDIIDILPQAKEIVDDLLSYCDVIDSTYNPTGIYKLCRTKSEELGKHIWVDKIFTHKDSNGIESNETVKVYSHYEPNDDTHVIVICDNLNNLSTEKGGSQLQTINTWTRDYCRLQITKHWGWTVLHIMQLSAEGEKQQYTNSGQSIIEKLEPSLDNLGNSKECARDMKLIFGLFAPDRYSIKKYGEYDITRLGDKFRIVKTIKSNISKCNQRVGFNFNGACSYWKELPLTMSEFVYNAVTNDTY